MPRGVGHLVELIERDFVVQLGGAVLLGWRFELVFLATGLGHLQLPWQTHKNKCVVQVSVQRQQGNIHAQGIRQDPLEGGLLSNRRNTLSVWLS